MDGVLAVGKKGGHVAVTIAQDDKQRFAGQILALGDRRRALAPIDPQFRARHRLAAEQAAFLKRRRLDQHREIGLARF